MRWQRRWRLIVLVCMSLRCSSRPRERRNGNIDSEQWHRRQRNDTIYPCKGDATTDWETPNERRNNETTDPIEIAFWIGFPCLAYSRKWCPNKPKITNKTMRLKIEAFLLLGRNNQNTHTHGLSLLPVHFKLNEITWENMNFTTETHICICHWTDRSSKTTSLSRATERSHPFAFGIRYFTHRFSPVFILSRTFFFLSLTRICLRLSIWLFIVFDSKFEHLINITFDCHLN